MLTCLDATEASDRSLFSTYGKFKKILSLCLSDVQYIGDKKPVCRQVIHPVATHVHPTTLWPYRATGAVVQGGVGVGVGVGGVGMAKGKHNTSKPTLVGWMVRKQSLIQGGGVHVGGGVGGGASNCGCGGSGCNGG